MPETITHIKKKYICTMYIVHTVCPRSSDPFYILIYYINGLILPGHTAPNCLQAYLSLAEKRTDSARQESVDKVLIVISLLLKKIMLSLAIFPQ